MQRQIQSLHLEMKAKGSFSVTTTALVEEEFPIDEVAVTDID